MPMQLSITTDYAMDTGCPEAYLRCIAEVAVPQETADYDDNENHRYIGKLITDFSAAIRAESFQCGPNNALSKTIRDVPRNTPKYSHS